MVGGGPPHLFVLEGLSRGRIPPTDVTLVSMHPRQALGGMIPGFVEGRYRLEEITIDLAAIVRRLGGTFVEGVASRLDPNGRTVTLDDGRTISYDVASLAVGGVPAGAGLPGVRRFARIPRPVVQLRELGAALDHAAANPGPEPLNVVVVGAGARGCELALAVRARLDRLGASRVIITLIDSSHAPLRDRSPIAQEEAERVLRAGEITLRVSTRAEAVGPDHVRLTGGRVLPADIVIWATGIEAPSLFRESGLPSDARGYLSVENTLEVPGCAGLFGAGDAVSLLDAPPIPKAGSHSFRQGPILADNLRTALLGSARRRRHALKPNTLALISAGDERAIFSYGGITITAGWAMRLKERIDRRFVRRFQRLQS